MKDNSVYENASSMEMDNQQPHSNYEKMGYDPEYSAAYDHLYTAPSDVTTDTARQETTVIDNTLYTASPDKPEGLSVVENDLYTDTAVC